MTSPADDLAPFEALQRRYEDGALDAQAFLQAVCAELAAAVGCPRAVAWLFVDHLGATALRCTAVFDTRAAGAERATDMLSTEVVPYFDTLLRDGCVVADDAWTHPATLGYIDEYLRPHDVHALMDVAFGVNHYMVGVLSAEFIGRPTTWTARQLTLMRRVGARLSVAMQRAGAVIGVPFQAPGPTSP